MTTYTWAGGSGSWTTAGNWTLDGAATDNIPGSSDDAVISTAGAYTVSVGTVTVNSITETDAAANLFIVNGLSVGTSLTSAGTISLASSGRLTTAGLANSGLLKLGSGAIDITGSVTTAGLGTVSGSGASITLSGTLDNTGATITASALSGITLIGNIDGGTIVNDTGSLSLGGSFPPPPFNLTGIALDDVTFVGPLTSTNVGVTDHLSVKPGSGGAGVITTERLNLFGSSSIDQGIVNFASTAANPEIDVFGTGTLGASTVVQGPLAAQNPFVKNGIFYQLEPSTISGGGTLIAQGSIDNAGSMTITVGDLQDFGIIHSHGTFGTVAGTLIPEVATLLIAPADASPVNNGTIISDLTTTTIQGNVAGSGTLELVNSGVIEVVGLYDQQNFDFLDATGLLKLDAASGTNVVDGFTVGDTIDLINTTATIDYSEGTVTASSGGNVFASFIMSGVPLDAQIVGQPDGAGGTKIIEIAPCFAAGTRIRTVHGEVKVEDLRAGDQVVMARDSHYAPIRWIGVRSIDCRRHPAPQKVWPVRIAAGAFGDGCPSRDVFLSPDHSVYALGVLIPVRLLCNGSSIAQVERDTVDYYHVELPSHDVLFAEGLPTESYLDTGDRGNFSNGGRHVVLYPDLTALKWEAGGCAPLAVTGPVLDAVRLVVAQAARLAAA